MINVGKNVSRQISELKADTTQNTVFISNYSRQSGETDDTGRFTRAIADLSTLGGGTLVLKREEYTLNSFTIPNNVTVKGQGKLAPWTFTNVTLLTYLGTSGTFITIESYHKMKGMLSDLNIRASTPSLTASTTGVRVKYSQNVWGGAAYVKDVSVYGFGVGIQHNVTYQSIVERCDIWQCGIGVSYNTTIPGYTVPGGQISSTFGNVNLVDKSTILECNIGVELASDIQNEIRSTDIEKCIIAINTYALTGGFPTPQQHLFNNCWIEANGWPTPTDRTNNTNKKTLIANSLLDASWNATGNQTASIPTFRNCSDQVNVSPQIPSHNTNYQTYSIGNEAKQRFYSDDELMKDFYSKPQHNIERVTVAKSGYWRDLFVLSNKGLRANIGFNTYEKRGDYTTSGVTTQLLSINYSDIINPEGDGNSNFFSSLALMTVIVSSNDGARSVATFLINDYHRDDVLLFTQIGTTKQGYGGILTGNGISIVSIAGTGSTDKTFNISVEANITKSITAKINFLPSGLLVTV